MKKRKKRFNHKELLAFGKHLKELRKAKGYSQERLADMAKMAESQVQRIELAQINPTLSTIFTLAHALNVPMKELCDIKTPPEK